MIYMFLSNNPSFGGYKFFEFVLFRSLFESIISSLAMNEISISLLVSVAEQAGLNITLLETLKTS